MATTVLTNAKILWSALDLTGVSNHVDLGYETEALDNTTFSTGGTRTFKGGLEKVTAHVDGFWEASANSTSVGPISIDDFAQASTGATNDTTPITIAPLGGADQDPCYFFKQLTTKYNLFGDVGKLAPYSLDCEGRGDPLLKGTVMLPLTTITTAGSGTIAQLGAVSSTQKLYAAMHVLTIAGTATPTLNFKVQSATTSGFGSPTDRITVNSFTTPFGWYPPPVAGAITDTWWRVSWTVSGTTPSFLAFVAVAIQ